MQRNWGMAYPQAGQTPLQDAGSMGGIALLLSYSVREIAEL